jgi:ATP-dependent Lon protease
MYPVGEFNSEHQINEFLTDIENKDSDNQFVKEWREYQIDIKEYIRDARKSLDTAVYGHKEAKCQLERIIGQWINGEAKGAVLGLEGPPGTGKTSLAKMGLSKCLKDENGEPRPFAFLPIGGSTNGSTLVGHNYTYVGSTWGRIVDILITTKCMNPIIFIDELDKVSRTENGKEIIGI